MTSADRLRQIGLFDARVPRYTSYPPANHFAGDVTPETAADWITALRPKSRVSLYVHIPYCRRLCWFCACRTQGTSTDRPLAPYLSHLLSELDMLDNLLPLDVEISRIHLGGGTPTLLPPEMLTELSARLTSLRPHSKDLEFAVEIDPTEVDAARIDALAAAGMTRASIGVQDFDPKVQGAIGRTQPYDLTRQVVALLRGAGVTSLNMDILYGLPYQNRGRISDSVQRVLSLNPDRVALYGYAHVPWMAKRQVMIPTDALPSAEARLELFEVARRLFLWDGYREVGIDHFAREGDSMADADRSGRLRRNFQGYSVDPSDALIGLGASAVSRYPQGYTQNHATSSRYAAAIETGAMPVARGHAMTRDDHIRAALIEDIMCRFELNLPELSARLGTPKAKLLEIVDPMLQQFRDQVEVTEDRIRITESARLLARLVAQQIDAYAMPEGRHSRAL